ncbi:3-oxoacyl-ACP synthase [Leptolyngbyaceae cyanobacterium CCMR0082]|uniref:3-oxoacyl-ACP synthase n=1 Tax=Adonisia turfae CCMR0082 TaxID=2304604 RepID=A0A6M0S070_9CYAN|nr:3-oxoacyl-[acyl-carrier-protein] synthase III C-terminal domain-containing protein [Adonisia turfae]NEZ61543.1 3-oxoacyl-ACP synthase [Adonisia turfae CCMR0082]
MTVHQSGISSLAVSFPKTIRTNDYWRQKYPELIPQPRDRRGRKSIQENPALDNLDIWSRAVSPYLSDPFRGNVERRVVDEHESSLMLECAAAKAALDASNLASNQIDLIIVSSLFAEGAGGGNAVALANQLGLSVPAWNLDSTCSGALIALQNACALVQTGEYAKVLVVASHLGSHAVEPSDTLAWSMGDGAGAFVVEALKLGQGLLGSKVVNTASTCGAYIHELVIDQAGNPRYLTRTGENMSMLAATAVDFVHDCCTEAIKAAGVTLEQIDYFAFSTPTPWYSQVCARALGINSERVINLYPRYANIGPVYPIANLYHGVLDGKICENDLVLVYSNGAGATAAAMVIRWGCTALGPAPAPPIQVVVEQEKPEHLQQCAPQPVSLISGKKEAQVHPYREKILAAESKAQRPLLETYLLEILRELLQHPDLHLESDESLRYLVDSLMALEIKRRIEFDLGIQVPIAKLFQNDEITLLAGFILNQLIVNNLTTQSSSSDAEEDLQEIIL